MYIIPIISCIVLVAIDQITKLMTIEYLTLHQPKEIINNFFNLTYVQNKGAAFGMLSDTNWARFIFIILTIVVISICAFYYVNLPKEKSFIKIRVTIVMFASGAIGNFVDRVFRGYVVDMLDFKIFGYDYPVFNFADILIVCSVVFMVIVMMFSSEMK